ncbi:MAG: Hsp20/alpha crystallin family protein [Patescibacteria group bacterium]
MSLIRWSPQSMWPDMEEFFDVPGKMMAFTPAVDVYEDKDNVIVETPLAGIKPEDVDIEIEENVLMLSGKTEKKSEVDEKNFYRKEIRTGSFHRAVALPKAVDSDKAEAKFTNGILKITIPKKEEAKPRKITVKAT